MLQISPIKKVILICLASLLLFNISCAKKEITQPHKKKLNDRPDWINHKVGMAKFMGEKALYSRGVGKSKSPQAASDEACGYAKVELASYIKTEVSSVIEASYKSSSDGENENFGKTVSNGFNNGVDRNLSGVGCVDMWTDPVNGWVYALARYDEEAVTKLLEDTLKAKRSANSLSDELEAKNDEIHKQIMEQIDQKFKD